MMYVIITIKEEIWIYNPYFQLRIYILKNYLHNIAIFKCIFITKKYYNFIIRALIMCSN